MDIRTVWIKYQQLVTGIVYVVGPLLCIVYVNDSLFFLLPLVFGIFLIIRFFRGGALSTAFWYANKGNIDAAQRILSTFNPSRLSDQKRTYFYFAQAMVDEGLNRSTSAVENFRQALYEGLLHQDDQAYAHLQLAKFYHLHGNEPEASNHLRLANRAVDADVIKTQISEFEESLTIVKSEPKPTFLFSD